MNRRDRIEALERRTPGTPMPIMLTGCEPGAGGPTPTTACRMGGEEIVERREGEGEAEFIARAERELFADAETVVVLSPKVPVT